MLRTVAITLVVLAIVACISSQDETRGLRDYDEDSRAPVNIRGTIRDAPVLSRAPSPPHREEEEKLSYVEKLLVAERLGSQQNINEEPYVSGQSDPLPETLGVGIEPYSSSTVDEESSEERLQRTRQTVVPTPNRINPDSPCPDVFSYDGTRAGKERWYGLVHLTTDTPLTGVRLVIRLNKRAQILGNWFGDVCSKDNIEFRIWNARKKLVPGPPHTVKIFVKFSDTELEPPRVRTISLNGKQICSSAVTRPNINHSGIIKTTARPTRRPTTTTRKTTVAYPPVTIPSVHTTVRAPVATTGGTNTAVRPPVGDVQCGKVEIQASPFITHGQRSSRGQWPWHAALYQAKGTDLSYICGGTLIGKNSVLTAAHCVTRAYNGRPVDPETILVYLGKYHLNLWTGTGGVQDRQVDTIKIHPEYNSTSFYADIAIIILSKEAEFTIYVKPVCLWDRRKIALREVEGVEGTVVGWGYDERGVVTEELMMAKMPVVSQQTCIWSYPAFFPRFTSEKTYCAGFRNGTSVCNGDSGGGMVFPIRDKPDAPERWYLRGLVSLGASQEEKKVCNTKHYVVFTDVAKYLDWIERTMSK